jgi:hypothetical protein
MMSPTLRSGSGPSDPGSDLQPTIGANANATAAHAIANAMPR